jgi:MOSC domain-containing protein YiiM
MTPPYGNLGVLCYSKRMAGKIISINVSEKKGVRKKAVDEVNIVAEFGIEGDAHASGEWHRQVSLLATESIKKMQDKGLKVGPGDFAENLTTEGIDLVSLPVGTRMRLGENIEAEVSQIGKLCHNRCAIYHQAGDCVMPREGIFIKIHTGGALRTGDPIEVL